MVRMSTMYSWSTASHVMSKFLFGCGYRCDMTSSMAQCTVCRIMSFGVHFVQCTGSVYLSYGLKNILMFPVT